MKMEKSIITILEAYRIAFDELKLEIKKWVKDATQEVLNEKTKSSDSDWITIIEAKKLLPYKSKTSWQKIRNQGVLDYTQSPNSRTILYSKKSIINYLNKNNFKF
jgi:hypothetical protein